MLPKVRLRRYVRLRFLIINGHVGEGLVNGAFRILLKRFRNLDIILIQEGRHARKWRDDLGPEFAVWPHPRETDQPMTYVAYRVSRFKVLGLVSRNIRHDGQYPRELDGLVLLDSKTGRKYSVSSFHVDPLGSGFDNANPHARKAQESQTAEFVQWHEEAMGTCLPFSGGDTNNWLPTEVSPGSVRAQFAKIGMVPLFTRLKKPDKVDLMELFAHFGTVVKAVKRQSIEIDVKGMDHPVLLATVKVLKS